MQQIPLSLSHKTTQRFSRPPYSGFTITLKVLNP